MKSILRLEIPRTHSLIKWQSCGIIFPAPFSRLLSSRLAVGGEMKPPEGSITPQMVEADGKLRLSFGEEILVLPRGLQPSLLRTKSGALIVHAQSRYIMVSQPAGKRFFRLKAP